jgi:hypothetical protein
VNDPIKHASKTKVGYKNPQLALGYS